MFPVYIYIFLDFTFCRFSTTQRCDSCKGSQNCWRPELQVNFMSNLDSLKLSNLYWMTTSYAITQSITVLPEFDTASLKMFELQGDKFYWWGLIRKVNYIHLKWERWPVSNLWFAGNVDCALFYLMSRADICWLSTVAGHPQNVLWPVGFIIFCWIAVWRLVLAHIPWWNMVSSNACFWLNVIFK